MTGAIVRLRKEAGDSFRMEFSVDPIPPRFCVADAAVLSQVGVRYGIRGAKRKEQWGPLTYTNGLALNRCCPCCEMSNTTCHCVISIFLNEVLFSTILGGSDLQSGAFAIICWPPPRLLHTDFKRLDH